MSIFTTLVVFPEYYRIHLTQKQLAALRGTSQFNDLAHAGTDRASPGRGRRVFLSGSSRQRTSPAFLDEFLISMENRCDQHGLYSGTHRCSGIRTYTVAYLDGTVLATTEIYPGATPRPDNISEFLAALAPESSQHDWVPRISGQRHHASHQNTRGATSVVTEKIQHSFGFFAIPWNVASPT